MGPVMIGGCDVQGRPSLSLMFVMAPEEGLGSGAWTGPLMTDESVCLDTPELEAADEIALKVRIVACTGQKRQRWRYDAEVSARGFPRVSSAPCFGWGPKFNVAAEPLVGYFNIFLYIEILKSGFGEFSGPAIRVKHFGSPNEILGRSFVVSFTLLLQKYNKKY